MLTDTDPFPFGMHKGKPMQDVPVEYLHWVWFNANGPHAEKVKEYIRENLNALKMEKRDLIWS